MALANLEKREGFENPKRMTWEEFLCWNPERPFWEWVDGEVVELMSVEINHAAITGFLFFLMTAFNLKHNAGRVIQAPFLMRLISRPAGREPDVLFLRTENLSRIQRTFINGPADLAVEVISPESEARDRETKFAEYEAGGVREYWLLDHFRQEAFFYQLGANGAYQRVLTDENGRYDSAVLPGFWLDVNWLWEEPKPLAKAMQALGL